MNKYRVFLLVGAVMCSIITFSQTPAKGPDGAMPDPKQALSDIIRDENMSPTSASDVVARFNRLVDLTRAMMRNNLPAHEVLPRQEAMRIESLIRNGELDQAATAVSKVIRGLGNARPRGTFPGEVPDSPRPNPGADSAPMSVPAGSGFDADNFLWGTEVYPKSLSSVGRNVAGSTLGMRYLKVRFQTSSFSGDGETFSPVVCLPSPDRCMDRYNVDDVVNLFKENRWSMVPMITHDRAKAVTPRVIEDYVDFVDWFISRYKADANIGYLELINEPVTTWMGTAEELAVLQNKVYERVKGKHPEIMVGTPGFEYWDGAARADHKMIGQIEYFLDRQNNVKFDFWAYHGYPTLEGKKIPLPPTQKAAVNKYAGLEGLIEIRKRLDSNGWSGRMIIDTEHVNIMSKPGPFISDEEDRITAAYTVQELLIKRTMMINGRYALGGIIPLKIGPRGDRGEFQFTSLKPDGSVTRTVRAVSVFVSKLREFKYSSHIGGELNAENTPWIEKFQSGNKELYVFFKPFNYHRERGIELDGQIVAYPLSLRRKPAKIILKSIDGDVQYPAPNQSIVLNAVNSPQFLEVIYD